MASVEVLFNTFPTVGQYFQKLFPGTVKSLEKVSAHFRQGCTKPLQLLFRGAGQLSFFVESIADNFHLFP